MEDTLRALFVLTVVFVRLSLNPCFNGRYSQRLSYCTQRVQSIQVLILVLMEDTLRGQERYGS